MNIYKHPINGSWVIWALLKNGIIAKEIYYFYNLNQSKSLFREKYPASQRETTGCNRVNWSIFLLN